MELCGEEMAASSSPQPKLIPAGTLGQLEAVLTPEAVFSVGKRKEDEWAVAQSDTFVVLTLGGARLHAEDGTELSVSAGEGVLLPRGAKTRWAWASKSAGVSVCVPALHVRLRALHEEARHAWLYHCAPRARWEAARASGETYFPETFEQDGELVHATADPSVLLFVLNHFYRASAEEWVCLRMSTASLLQRGIETVFEPAAPVGATPASTDPAISSAQLFPHVLGGIPPAAVLEVTPVVRARDGSFVEVAGVTATAARTSLAGPLLGRLRASPFAAGLTLGAAGGALVALALARRAGP